jgi:hypothetical protein
VRASQEGRTYRTVAVVGRRAPVDRLRLGHTLPRGSSVESVRLDGRSVGHRSRLTNRGLEVSVRAPSAGRHELVVTAR